MKYFFGALIVISAAYSFQIKKKKVANIDLSSPLTSVEDSLSPFQILFKAHQLMREELHLKDTVILVDLSLPSDQKRMWVLNLKTGDTLMNDYVAHGKNSGGLEAVSFSNKPGSRKSSLGFYVTAETYIGSKGFSLKMNGLEYGINHKARERGIVIHGASYVGDSFLKQNQNVLGRSWGCPAVNEQINQEFIETIKDNCLFFIYAKDNNYLSNSKMIKNVRHHSESYTNR